jgi:hypothetical protein
MQEDAGGGINVYFTSVEYPQVVVGPSGDRPPPNACVGNVCRTPAGVTRSSCPAAPKLSRVQTLPSGPVAILPARATIVATPVTVPVGVILKMEPASGRAWPEMNQRLPSGPAMMLSGPGGAGYSTNVGGAGVGKVWA